MEGAEQDQVPAPQRGQQLSLLLETLSTKYAFGEDKYGGFVSLADTAVREMRSSGMLSVAFSSQVKKAAAEGAGVRKGGPDDKNSSLLLIFMFYAAMQIGSTASFSATQLANETMTLYELDKFCRDFKIIPNMLSKTEVKAVWALFGTAYSLKYRAVLQAMTFADFQDLFVRLALAAYNKRGMRKMIVAVSGSFPPPEQLVGFFASYCHLDDYSRVKHIIRTQGHATQGALNFRSANEGNARAREEQLIDLRAKAAMRQAKHEEKLAEDEFNRKKTEKAKKEALHLKALRDAQLPGSPNAAPSSSLAVSGDGHENTTATSDPGMLHRPKRKPTKDELRRRELVQKDIDQSTLPAPILEMLVGKRAMQHREAVLAASKASIFSSSSSSSSSSFPLLSSASASATASGTGAAGEEEEGDEYDDEFRAVDEMSAGYSPALVDELAKYSYNEPGFEPEEGAESFGPFLDMGNVSPRSVCTLTISTTNLLPDDLTLDIVARNFNSAKNDTHVKTKTKPIVPGMSRQHVVTFSSQDTLCSTVGLVTLVAASERCNLRCELVCPVFCRIDPTVQPRSLLTMRNLADAKARFLGAWAREELRISFERKMQEGFAPLPGGSSRPGSRAGSRSSRARGGGASRGGSGRASSKGGVVREQGLPPLSPTRPTTAAL